MRSTTLIILLLTLIAAGCASSIGRPANESDSGPIGNGNEGWPCFANKTCHAPLVCLSNTCVRLPDSMALKDAGARDAGAAAKDLVGSLPDGKLPPGTLGSVCDGKTKCPPGLTCVVTSIGGNQGYCTVGCKKKGEPCSGAPAGMAAYCIGQDKNFGNFCVFLCAIKDAKGIKQTFLCPSFLSCEASGQSGVAVCK